MKTRTLRVLIPIADPDFPSIKDFQALGLLVFILGTANLFRIRIA
jgi:hypothetical protein